MGEGTYVEHLDGSDVMLLTTEEFEAKCKRVFGRIEGTVADYSEFNTPLEELKCSEVSIEMLLASVQREIIKGWEHIPELRQYFSSPKKLNKYQRRYRNIGRKRK